MAIALRLYSAFRVDLCINRYEDRIIIIRFGDEAHPDCKPTDEWILKSRNEHEMSNAAIFLVDTRNVPELVARYNLSGPCTLVFFHGNSISDRLSGEDIKRARDVEKKNFVDVVKKTCEKNKIKLGA